MIGRNWDDIELIRSRQYWYATTALFNNEYDRYLNGNDNTEASPNERLGDSEEASSDTNESEDNRTLGTGTALDGQTGITRQDEGRRTDLPLPYQINRCWLGWKLSRAERTIKLIRRKDASD